MASIKLKYVSGFKDRHGKARWRFRKKGLPACYLPGEPGSREFLDAYDAALQGKLVEAKPIGRDRSAPYSLSRLIEFYYATTTFDRLKESTKRTYRSTLEPLRNEFGHLSARTVTRKHVEALITQLGETPTMANKRLKRLKTLFDFAVDERWRTDNPAKNVKPYKIESDGWHTWTDQEIADFCKTYPTGSRERLAFALFVCTGQRGSDVIRMGLRSLVRLHDGALAITVRQEKTRTPLVIPVFPELETELAARKTNHFMFLTSEHGKRLSTKYFQQWFCDKAKEATGNEECKAHGLRKVCASRLADAGATPFMIAAITGHKSLKEVERYTAKRDQIRLARSAQALLTRSTLEEHPVSNPSDGLDTFDPSSLKTKEL